MALEDTTDLPLTASQHQGRILRVDFTWQQQRLTVVAVYAPSTGLDRQGFFRDLLLPVIPHHGHVLVGGDFNCVGSDLDVTPNAVGRRRTGYVQGLQLVEDTLSLMDAWREQHHGMRQITYTCAADPSGARLDRLLVSETSYTMFDAQALWWDYQETTWVSRSPCTYQLANRGDQPPWPFPCSSWTTQPTKQS